jgi:hypothetical protein
MAAIYTRKSLSSFLPLALLSLPIACIGQVGDGPTAPSGRRPDVPDVTTGGSGGSGGSGGTGGTGGPPVTAADCKGLNVGPSPVRRLTHVEYNNAVADLLGDTTRPANEFPDDSQAGLFKNTASLQTVPPLLAEGYLNAAAQLAERANVRDLTGCDLAAASCVPDFIQRFGRRAYRRPLNQAEGQRLQQVFENARTKADPETGVRAVVASVLVAPQFLYFFEVGGQDTPTAGVKKLAPFEVAARLGSLLWASLPDETLLNAAASGQLATREQVSAQAQRMLKDPRARAATNVFYEQWFGMHELDTANKDTMLFPNFAELRTSMREETVRFVNHVVWEADGKLSTLLAAPYTFVDAKLAAVYGVTPPSGQGFERVSLDPAERGGVVTQAFMLAGYSGMSETSPFKRGAWLRTRLLCQDLPAPPNEVPPLPEPKEGVSLRERAEQHTSVAACASCHKMIDGLGFGLEQFDAIGKLRTMDHGKAVDTSGEVTETNDIDGKFNGGAELAKLLAKSAQVRDCAPTQWLRYAMARPETKEDACSLDQLKRSFSSSGGNLKELLLALTQTDAFLHYRRPEGP